MEVEENRPAQAPGMNILKGHRERLSGSWSDVFGPVYISGPHCFLCMEIVVQRGPTEHNEVLQVISRQYLINKLVLLNQPSPAGMCSPPRETHILSWADLQAVSPQEKRRKPCQHGLREPPHLLAGCQHSPGAALCPFLCESVPSGK